jgi:hypothetical protein
VNDTYAKWLCRKNFQSHCGAGQYFLTTKYRGLLELCVIPRPPTKEQVLAGGG